MDKWPNLAIGIFSHMKISSAHHNNELPHNQIFVAFQELRRTITDREHHYFDQVVFLCRFDSKFSLFFLMHKDNTVRTAK